MSDSRVITSYLNSLSDDARQALLARATVQRAKKGDTLFLADEPNGAVYVLQHGRVKIYGLAAEGKELILWFCFPGDLFGLSGTDAGTRGVCARAGESSDVLSIPREDFREFLLNWPDAALRVIDTLGQRLRVLSDAVQNLAATSVSGRVISLLQRLGTTHGHRDGETIHLEIPLTHQDIADMIGCCRQSVTETLGTLKRAGAIAYDHHHVRILDRAALSAAAH
jgi:CRP/FNR family transcriptional regulator